LLRVGLKALTHSLFLFEGSPFHPRIIDPTKVEVVDDRRENWTAVDRLTIPVDELYDIVFDCGGAGPGMCILAYFTHNCLNFNHFHMV